MIDDVFRSRYAAGVAQAVVETLSADVHTPVGVFLRVFAGEQNAFLYESVERGVRGRYSVLGGRPDAVVRAPATAQTIDLLKNLPQGVLPDGMPAACAGYFGMLGYDLPHGVERLPPPPPDPLHLPDVYLIRPSIIAVFDTRHDVLHLSAPVYPQPGISADDAHAAAQQRLRAMRDKLHAPLSADAANWMPSSSATPQLQPEQSRESYEATVRRCIEYIRAGDVFQVVPSQRFRVDYPHSGMRFYRALRQVNPSPYMFRFVADDFEIIGASPELLVRVQNRHMSVRPIAGTRPRGNDAAADAAFEAQLRADPKENAEHLMLLDLGRNDVGRVCDRVSVDDAFVIERYSHVMHLVSQVSGRLRDDVSSIDALLSGFPAGTVSGAPKLRAAQIIAELEPVKRAFYAGGMGYFSINGDVDTCITLRTALLRQNTLYLQAGAGIVADSDPAAEYDETLNKAAALLRAAAL